MSVEQIESNVGSIRATLQSLLADEHQQGLPATFLNNLVRCLPAAGWQVRVETASRFLCQSTAGQDVSHGPDAAVFGPQAALQVRAAEAIAADSTGQA